MTTRTVYSIYRTRKKILATFGALLMLLIVDGILLSPGRHLVAAPMDAPSTVATSFSSADFAYGSPPVRLTMNGRELEQETGCAVSTYQVQPGDTIADVARRAGVSSQRVRECNGLTSNVVQAGQQLFLPGAVTLGGVSAPGARITRTYPQYASPRYSPPSRQQSSPYQGRSTWSPRRR